MFRVDDPSAVASMPALLAAGVPGFFGRGDPGNGVRPTVLTVDWANIVQEELVAIVAAAGISLDKADMNQVLDALRVLFGSGRLINVFRPTSNGNIALNTATTWCRCILVGAGGGGGGAEATIVAEGAAGGGGAAGSYVEIVVPAALIAGDAYAIGTGGAGGAGVNNGSPGGWTTIGSLTAHGGGGGGGGNATTLASVTLQGLPSALTPVTTGSTTVIAAHAGQPGQSGFVLSPGAVSGQASGTGAPGPYGGGGRNVSNGDGWPAVGIGAGGGGAGNEASESARTGGTGGDGMIVVFEYT